MAKIKSTLDLIMEKTKNMSLSDEEKRALQHQELEERVKIFTYRFVQNERETVDTLLAELESIQSEDRKQAKSACLRILTEEFSFTHEDPRILQGIQKVGGNIPDEQFQERLGALRAEFRRKEDALRKEATVQGYRELESEGIRGSALVPHVESTSFWQLESKKMTESFREALLEKLSPTF